MTKIRIDNTRDKILEVAEKLFGRFGFYKTSMDEIAKISRKAKGSLYYHFESKEELFKEVVKQELESVKSILNVIIENPDFSPEKKLGEYFLTRMDTLQGATNYHEMLKADFYEHFDFVDKVRQDFDSWESGKLTEIISEGIARGDFRPVLSTDILTDVFNLLIKSLEIPLYVQGKYDRYSRYMDDLIIMLLKNLK